MPSEQSERKKQQQDFQSLKMDKIPATSKRYSAKIKKFPNFSLTFLEFKISLNSSQNSLIPDLKENKIFPNFFPTSSHLQ